MAAVLGKHQNDEHSGKQTCFTLQENENHSTTLAAVLGEQQNDEHYGKQTWCLTLQEKEKHSTTSASVLGKQQNDEHSGKRIKNPLLPWLCWAKVVVQEARIWFQ